MISTVEVLKLMEAFVNEPNYTVWSDLSCNLGVLSSLLSHTDFHEEIQEFIRDLFTPIGMKLGWDSKPGEGERRTSDSLSIRCPTNQNVLTHCLWRGWSWIDVVGHLDALLRGLVLGKLGKAGHKPTLEEARRRFKEHVEGKQVLPADLRSPVRDAEPQPVDAVSQP